VSARAVGAGPDGVGGAPAGRGPAGSGPAGSGEAVLVDDALLARWPLPFPAPDADKESRGRVLVVAGSVQVPGAVRLAAEAAMRAGAGKLAIATVEPIAAAVALAVPEALVIGLPCRHDGIVDVDAAIERLAPHAARCDALLVGPGMDADASTCVLACAVIGMAPEAAVLLDAAALGVLEDAPPAGEAPPVADAAVAGRRGGRTTRIGRLERPVLITPHAGEMARLCGRDKASVLREAEAIALDFAARRNAVVVLKGGTTHVAGPDGERWRNERGDVGLGASGSGDVLAGLTIGLAARGAPLAQAAVWGVALHARAGERLARRVGRLGYLARELADEVPSLMDELARVG
jgi:hydroxyethylthiazole kinase-like uncharacterized protein yjeF